MKETKVKLKLENIYGGDGFERPHEVEEVKLKRSKSTVTIRKDVGVPIEKEKKERKTETKEVSVNTFKHDKNGNPLYRLGGTHGKLWGAMKEAGYSMYQTGELENKITTDRTMRSVQIMPQWVPLETENGVEMNMDELPQVLNTAGNSMVQTYFDVIPECQAEVTLRYPEALEELVMKLLDRAQTVNFGNKRRGTMTIIEKEAV